MNKFSLSQAGTYVALISFLLGLFKVNISTAEVSQFVEAAFVIIGLATAFYGRYRVGDLKLSGIRK